MWWKKLDKPKVILFSTGTGYVMYEVRAWSSPDDWASPERVEAFADALCASGLEWYWSSYHGLLGSKGPPEARLQSLRRLDASSIVDLVHNASWEDPDTALEIRMYGFEAPFEARPDENRIRAMMRDFVSGEAGPLVAVIHRICDTAPIHCYVPCSPHPAIIELLARYGASPEAARRGRLWRSSLLRLEQAYGFRNERSDKAARSK